MDPNDLTATSVQYECNWNRTWSPSPQTSPPTCVRTSCIWPPDNATLEENVVPHKFDNEPVPSMARARIFNPGIALRSVVEVFCPNTFLQMTTNGYGQYQCEAGNKWGLPTSKLKCEHGEQIFEIASYSNCRDMFIVLKFFRQDLNILNQSCMLV